MYLWYVAYQFSHSFAITTKNTMSASAAPTVTAAAATAAAAAVAPIAQCKNPFSLINERRNKGVKISDDEILIAFDAWLCYSVKKSCCKENCIACLVDNDIRQGVGRYLLQWGEKDSHDHKTIIAEWYRYENPCGFKNKKQTYKLPYDASGLGEMTCHQFANVTLCLSGLHTIFDLGQRKWESIKKVANTFGVSPIHKGRGQPGNRCL